MNRRIRRAIHTAIGAALIAAAFVLVFLPIVPTILALAGLLVLSREYVWAGRTRVWLSSKLPKRRRNDPATDQTPDAQ